jgi:hypothetical protein
MGQADTGPFDFSCRCSSDPATMRYRSIHSDITTPRPRRSTARASHACSRSTHGGVAARAWHHPVGGAHPGRTRRDRKVFHQRPVRELRSQAFDSHQHPRPIGGPSAHRAGASSHLTPLRDDLPHGTWSRCGPTGDRDPRVDRSHCGRARECRRSGRFPASDRGTRGEQRLVPAHLFLPLYAVRRICLTLTGIRRDRPAWRSALDSRYAMGRPGTPAWPYLDRGTWWQWWTNSARVRRATGFTHRSKEVETLSKESRRQRQKRVRGRRARVLVAALPGQRQEVWRDPGRARRWTEYGFGLPVSQR